MPVARRFSDPKPGQDVVAVSRSLNPALVLQAYRQGIFPWPVRQGLVPWASPDPRAIFPLEDRRPWPRTVEALVQAAVPRQLRRGVRPGDARLRRPRRCGHLDHADILATYDELHALGWAHSVEVWNGPDLVGGLYGIALGALFAGESMYHRETGASKVAFASCADRLRERGFRLFDVQVLTDHLRMLGCIEIPRSEYLQRTSLCLHLPARFT